MPQIPDVIHAHFADAAEVAFSARDHFGIPVVYTPHSLAFDKRESVRDSDGFIVRVNAERKALKAADAIVVSTSDERNEQLRAYAVSPGDTRVHCLPPGIPSGVRTLAPVSSQDCSILNDLLDQPKKPIVLAIARPVWRKNLLGLMRAYSASEALSERANLVIVAGQHNRSLSPEGRDVVAHLRSLALSPALRGRVTLPPQHSGADIAALYRRASLGGVFVNPALHEPFGLTLLEAAFCGTPVVATRSGGPVDIIRTIGHGVLVDPRDEPALAGACLKVVTNRRFHRKLAKAAVQNAHRYSWSNYAERSVRLYASLIHTCRPPSAFRTARATTEPRASRVAA